MAKRASHSPFSKMSSRNTFFPASGLAGQKQARLSKTQKKIKKNKEKEGWPAKRGLACLNSPKKSKKNIKKNQKNVFNFFYSFFKWQAGGPRLPRDQNAISTCQKKAGWQDGPPGSAHFATTTYGLLQPLPAPQGVWEDISLDFIIGLPSFQNHTVILVVVDRFLKAAHLGMLPTNFTAAKVAELFAQLIYRMHGMPKSIMSDRDPIFLSKFWKELFQLNGTKLRMSTAYHPQTDGQTEVVNKALQQYLRCFAHQQPHTWGKYLHWAKWHYTTAIHSSTSLSPFHVLGKATMRSQ